MAKKNATEIFPVSKVRDMLVTAVVPASSSVRVQFEHDAMSGTWIDITGLVWTTAGSFFGRFNPCGLRYRVLVTGTATYELTNQS